ncbi:MAG: Crp/Fnr family transcriptional regulator [Bacteroidales bacterium]|nr:Crp/Fnr family transcriptional regulator [Bacteroidales bacterium]
MKINKEINCTECENQCDIFDIIKTQNDLLNKVKPIHVTFKKNDIICKQGNTVTHGIYIVSGTAKLYIEGLNNRNIILYILKPHNYVGLLSFFETPRYFYSVVALEQCKVCMVDVQFIKQLYRDNHLFLCRLNEAFGKSVASIMQKIITLNQKNIRGRFADSLLYLSQLNKNLSFNLILTRKELGELCAISEENIVRLLAEFKNEKIIDVQKKQITILDETLLRKISEVG